MKYTYILISIFIIQTQCLFSQTITGQSEFKIDGEVTNPLALTVSDLEKMNTLNVEFKDRDGNTYTYTGVSVYDILKKAGASTGKQLHGENLSKYVLAKASDGYEVVFSMAELDSSFTDKVSIIAYKVNGKPLPTNKGNFRMIIPNERNLPEASFS